MGAQNLTTLGGCQLVERIGAGGMGEVWRGERVGVGNVRRRVAVKRILPEFQKDAALRGRFLAEAKINARMEHPNVVQVLDFGDQPELYLVLEYVDGLPLSDLLGRAVQAGGGIPLAAALYIIAEAATGLDYAHRLGDENGQPLGIVHRDVSPSNVLLSIDGAVKVNDFGVAKAADNRYRTEAGLAVGKLVYMAPEQAAAEKLDHRADVFSLGVVLWELLALRPLLPRNDPGAAIAALARCDFPWPSSVIPSVPASIDAIVMEALAQDPSRRTPSAGRMAKALRTALAGISPGYDARDVVEVIESVAPEIAARGGRAELTFSSTPKGVSANVRLPDASGRGPAAVQGAQQRVERTPLAPAARLAAGAQGTYPAGYTSAPTAGPAAASLPGTRPAADPRRKYWIAGALAVFVVGLGSLAVGLSLSGGGAAGGGGDAVSSASASGGAPTMAPGGDPASAAQGALSLALPAGVSQCATGTYVHGTVAVDVTYLPDGTAGEATVRVDPVGLGNPSIAQCVRAMVLATQTSPTPSGVTVPTVVVPF